eukprot:scaffold31387_cov48-Phaeocystis_antarctica.AAC.1
MGLAWQSWGRVLSSGRALRPRRRASRAPLATEAFGRARPTARCPARATSLGVHISQPGSSSQRRRRRCRWRALRPRRRASQALSATEALAQRGSSSRRRRPRHGKLGKVWWRHGAPGQTAGPARTERTNPHC